jgi:lipoprotein-anchoring transpeptidase ErfK/SrfK
MSPRTRTLVLVALALAAVAGIALGGWAIVDSRAEGSGRVLVPTPTPTVEPSPSVVPTDGPTTTPTASPTASPSPGQTRKPLPPREREYWLVAMLNRQIPVYDKPSMDARVRMELPAKTRYGVETVCLVRKIEETSRRVWYNVWLPTGPNGARGWIGQRGITLYPVYTQIVIDLSERRLTVLEGSEKELGSFSVAIGEPRYPTPTGQYFITEKVKPTDPTTAYGVLAMALSAYSPQLADRPEWAGGQVAIHGTNQPQLIGQAISHGCIRMKNEDVLTVDKLVKTGSPVTIVR